MLHVTNGDSATAVLAHAGFEGDLLAWRDVLHEGPVRGALTPDARRAERAAFIAGSVATDAADIEAAFRARDERLAAALRAGEPVALWFEHDLFDQWQLLEVLVMVAAIGGTDAEVELVLPSDYIGTFRPAQAHAAWELRRKATAADLAAAIDAWEALTADDPRGIAPAIAADAGALPHLKAALHRHAEEFPATGSGLSRTERQLLEAIAAGVPTLRALFPATHHEREDPIFLGDTVFLAIVQRLATARTPLVRALAGGEAPRDAWARPLALTDAGRGALAGAFDHARENRVARWLGGVAIGGGAPDWRWDAARDAVILAG
ncbi:MAG: DUF1835 domain-containing protein [Gemmatimonadetes bacterium]|nr:DUF1835 domain-containing protein [Gemmatimonadota bacterium]